MSPVGGRSPMQMIECSGRPLLVEIDLPDAARRGFTLVELMVVVLVVGFALILLLPVLANARANCRSIGCLNSMRQVALAATTHESAHGWLPAGGLVAEPEVEPRTDSLYFDPLSGQQMSWVTQILPFMEEQFLFDSIDFDVSMTQQSGDPQSVAIGSLMCASDSGSAWRSQFVFEGKTFAKANFVGFASPYRLETMSHWPGSLGGVRPGRRRGLMLSEIVDGQSKTLFASEVRTNDTDTDQRGAWALPWVGASLLTLNVPHLEPLDAAEDISKVWYKPATAAELLVEAQTPNKTLGVAFDRLYRCESAGSVDEGMPCTQTPDGLGLYAAPRSLHSGGVNTVAVGGNGGFLSNDIDAVVFARLVAVNDGQLDKRTGDAQ